MVGIVVSSPEFDGSGNVEGSAALDISISILCEGEEFQPQVCQIWNERSDVDPSDEPRQTPIESVAFPPSRLAGMGFLL